MEDVAIWETRNIDEHVELIRRQFTRSLRDEKLRELAVKIITGTADDVVRDRGVDVPVVYAYGRALRLPSSNPTCVDDAVRESQAIWDFYVLNVEYTPDPVGYDLFMTAKHTLESGQADCDDAAITMGALHRLVGFESLVARVVSTNAEYWEHVYLLVGFPKRNTSKWMPLDPTVRGAVPGWQYPKIKSTRDFML
jgi:hypothetical protein